MGQRPGLELEVVLTTSPGGTEGLLHVCLRARPFGCGPEQGRGMLERVAPELMRSLRDCLQLSAERRHGERLPFDEAVQVFPVGPDGAVGGPVAARGKDISPGGLGLYLPFPPQSDRLYVEVRPPQQDPLVVPARILHSHPCGEGRYDVGVQFLFDG
jgi:hypothetical protein